MVIVFDTFFLLLRMQPMSLLHVDSKQSTSGTHAQYLQGDTETEEYVTGNETEKRHAEGDCCNEDKASPDAHKLQGHLETFIHGIAVVACFHTLINNQRT